MITEIVTFKLKDGMDRATVTADYEKSVPVWKGNPALLHKSYLFDEAKGIGGGVYLWTSKEAAQTAHGAGFVEKITGLFGSAPEFQYFDSPLYINNHKD